MKAPKFLMVFLLVLMFNALSYADSPEMAPQFANEYDIELVASYPPGDPLMIHMEGFAGSFGNPTFGKIGDGVN